MKMRAAIAIGVGAPVEVAEIDLAGPREGEVLVRIAASGLCASDLNALDGKRTLVPFPAVLGHEAAGEVVERGPGVNQLDVGDRVVLSIVPRCGDCAHCRAGRPNYCSTAGAAMGAGGLFDATSRLTWRGERLNHFLTVSSFAQYAVVPASGAVRIPDPMPLDRAALLSCAVLTGVGAVRRTAKVRPGSRVVVFGCGGVGLNIVQGARMAGAARILAVDIGEDKLALARTLGATDTVNSRHDDPVTAARDLFGGADHAFEALGREQTIQTAWASLDVQGQLTLVGLLASGARLTLDADPFVSEQSVQGCYFGSSDLTSDVPELAQRYLDGDLLLDPLISRRITLDDVGEGFDALRRGEGARHVLVFD